MPTRTMSLRALCSFLLILAIAAVDPPVFTLPEISYQDLLVLDPYTTNDLKKQLINLGAVQITNIPRFLEAKSDALEDAAECLSQRQENGIIETTMHDGSVRYSSVAKSVDGIRQRMSHECGEPSSKLRALIDAACAQVFKALDSLLPASSGVIMAPDYKSFTSLMSKGNHLEHLHAYFPPKSAASAQPDAATLSYHTDNGLMIAMTTGLYENGAPSSKSGLYITLPNGKNVKVSAADSSLVLLMGEGAAKWFAPVLGKSFRAVPHALFVDIPVGEKNSRSWFGKMHLPPSDAIVAEGSRPLAYGAYHSVESRPGAFLPAACEASQWSVFVQDVGCAENELMCWNKCQSVASLPCGMAAQCINLKTDELSPPTAMCMDGAYPDGTYCVLECLDHPANASSLDDYCSGEGTSMSMSGFVSVVSDQAGTSPCINVLFDTWTLDSAGKFAAACLGVLVTAVAVQYLQLLRGRAKSLAADPTRRRLVKIALFSVQLLLSYFLMLVAMTYSAELFSMVIVGLSIGYALFHSAEKKGGAGAGAGGEAEISAEPCCPEAYENFDDDVIIPINSERR